MNTSPGAFPAHKSSLSIHTLDVSKHAAALKRAILIHNQAAAAITNFHVLYKNIIQGEKELGDTPEPHREQDLLRAMLLFACSGLDAVVKQLVRDTLKPVLRDDAGAQREFRKYVERRLKKGPAAEDRERQNSGAVTDVGFLSELLVAFDSRAFLIESLTEALVADSLQSRDQLLKVAAHFALTRDDVMSDDKTTKEAFEVRNQITHEMDIDLTAGKGRRERSYVDMVSLSENISGVSKHFVEQVSAKIKPRVLLRRG